MLGKRSDQKGLWEADRLYLDHVGKDTFYGLLASLRGQLFSDDDFAEIYCPDNGRDSVPPSLLATALLLQTYDRVSDAEAKARADFDIRWKVALGIEIEDRPFAKSTLQMFRAQLILHDKVREVFESSLRLARQSGYLKKRGMRVALDTTYILGRGAVKDTYNLLADGIVKLLRALAAVAIAASMIRRASLWLAMATPMLVATPRSGCGDLRRRRGCFRLSYVMGLCCWTPGNWAKMPSLLCTTALCSIASAPMWASVTVLGPLPTAWSRMPRVSGCVFDGVMAETCGFVSHC